MAVAKPVAVPQKKIDSVEIPNFEGGLNLNGAQDAPRNSFIDSKDVELSIDSYIIPRRVLSPFLPDTVEKTYQKYPVDWNGHLYYFTADNGKIMFCQQGDTTWTACGGDNTITTNNGGKPRFLRILDNVILLNGTNGDKLCYVNLSTLGFPVVKYTLITDPTSPFTDTLNNLTTGAFKIYYAYSYTGSVGETNLSPILTQSINVVRDQWQTQTTPASIKLTRPGSPPTGAKFWNLYIALASTGGTIQVTDMLQLAVGLDLNQADFVDDGSLSINLSAIAPTANSTDGPRVDYAIVEEGNPILFGDVDSSENIWIGGGGPYAMDFSVANGGYLAQPEQGTNFHPTVVIGFRNGQGIPSLTVLFSNTEGLSKQSVLEQQTVNYGNQSFTVWGVTEQHYGAAGVAATDSAINYNGKLLFVSTDGILSMNTQPLRQNVITIDSVSAKAIDKYIRGFKNSAMNEIVGAGWNSKFMWAVPNDGFDTPQQLLILDDNNNGAWYPLDVAAQWVGVVTPSNTAAIVYVCQGVSTYKLTTGTSTFDTKGGLAVPFSTKATGAFVGMSNEAGAPHNIWQASVQAVFDVEALIGDITVGVNYYDQNGNFKTKQKTYHGPAFQSSTAGGWGDPAWDYAGMASPAWSGDVQFDQTAAGTIPKDVRIKVPTDDVMNEAQWFFFTPVGYSSYKFRPPVFEGVNLGVRPDLQ